MTVCLPNDVPIETLSKVLRHRSIRTTQIYAKITAEKVSRQRVTRRTALAVNNPSPKSGDFRETWLYNYILAPILGLFQIETIYLYYMLIK